MKPESRDPKSERNPKLENQIGIPAGVFIPFSAERRETDFRIRTSDFFRISGIQVSDLEYIFPFSP
jgi:hypothetical protein